MGPTTAKPSEEKFTMNVVTSQGDDNEIAHMAEGDDERAKFVYESSQEGRAN